MSRHVIFSAHIRVDFERTLYDAAFGHLTVVPSGERIVTPAEIEKQLGTPKAVNIENCLKVVLSGKVPGCVTLAIDCTERVEE